MNFLNPLYSSINRWPQSEKVTSTNAVETGFFRRLRRARALVDNGVTVPIEVRVA
jgi:hypothetical protein